MYDNVPDNIYEAWRRSEAFAVPMTDEGYQKAAERFSAFRKGYTAGVHASSILLEKEHAKNKGDHKFFYKASQMVLNLLKKV